MVYLTKFRSFLGTPSNETLKLIDQLFGDSQTRKKKNPKLT